MGLCIHGLSKANYHAPELRVRIYRVMYAYENFGEHKRCVRIAQGDKKIDQLLGLRNEA